MELSPMQRSKEHEYHGVYIYSIYCIYSKYYIYRGIIASSICSIWVCLEMGHPHVPSFEPDSLDLETEHNGVHNSKVENPEKFAGHINKKDPGKHWIVRHLFGGCWKYLYNDNNDNNNNNICKTLNHPSAKIPPTGFAKWLAKRCLMCAGGSCHDVRQGCFILQELLWWVAWVSKMVLTSHSIKTGMYTYLSIYIYIYISTNLYSKWVIDG